MNNDGNKKLYVYSDDIPEPEPFEVSVAPGDDGIFNVISKALVDNGYRISDSGSKQAMQKPKRRITFGRYMRGDAVEPIDWIVLRQKEDCALIITAEVIDAHRFDPESNDWETCELRAWLNGEFAEAAFNADEQAMITESATGDRIFLLSAREADAYFADDDERRGIPTEYAVARGVNHHDWAEGYSWWWIRTRGQHTDHNEGLVSTFGSVFGFGDHVTLDHGGVRPAVWIKCK